MDEKSFLDVFEASLIINLTSINFMLWKVLLLFMGRICKLGQVLKMVFDKVDDQKFFLNLSSKQCTVFSLLEFNLNATSSTREI